VGLLRALRWVDEMQLPDMDVEIDCKIVVDSLYSHRTRKLYLGAILSNCKIILVTNPANSHVKVH
jgi:hypothetical protein